MTEREKITQLAKASGFVSLDIEYIVDTVYPMFEAFYHKAQREAFEQAAEECWKANEYGFHRTNGECEEAIRQLIKE